MPEPSNVQKKCPRCGAGFGCKQQEGCWCSALHVDPAVLAEIRAKFSDCLCEACLRILAAGPQPARSPVAKP